MFAGSDLARYDVFKEWNSHNWFELTTTLLGHTGKLYYVSHNINSLFLKRISNSRTYQVHRWTSRRMWLHQQLRWCLTKVTYLILNGLQRKSSNMILYYVSTSPQSKGLWQDGWDLVGSRKYSKVRVNLKMPFKTRDVCNEQSYNTLQVHGNDWTILLDFVHCNPGDLLVYI
jgi:hypothetical protein